MNHVLLVAAGGAIGTALRHWSGLISMRFLGNAFPYGTMIVNVTGSLVMGLLVAWLVRKGGTDSLRLFMATGILGGFTTFSAFSLDVVNLIERGAILPSVGYIAASVILSLMAVFAGLWFGRAFL